MGQSVDTVFVETYERTVRHLAQQGITRLRPWVVERSVQSEAHNWERLGAREAIAKTTRLQITPSQDYPWTRRKSEPITFNTGDDTEQEDIVQMLVDPNSNIAIAQGKAMRRALDNEIIAAAVGDSRDGDGGAVVIPVGQTIGVQDTPVPMTFDLVTQVSEIFMDNDIDPDEEKVFVVSPRQARKLLQLTEATSGDYNALRPLTSKGYIESWMGYSWLVSTLLPDSSSGLDDSENHIFAMTRRALGLQMNKDIWVRIAEDPSFSFVWRVYCASTYGAIRVEDEQLVRINCSTTI
jgi:hypothetical protein